MDISLYMLSLRAFLRNILFAELKLFGCHIIQVCVYTPYFNTYCIVLAGSIKQFSLSKVTDMLIIHSNI
jgi:hypothetical protein